MLLRLIWLCCLIVAGAGATLWFLNQRVSYTETSTGFLSDKPSVSFKDIEMIINSTAGDPQYKLSSPKYWLYDDEKRSEFELPDIEIYQNNGNKVFAKALKGNTSEGNDIITLIGNVEINHPQSEENAYALEVFTDSLTVFPKKQRATTDAEVIAKRGNQTIKAIGMTFDLDTQIVYLHSQVTGQHEP